MRGYYMFLGNVRDDVGAVEADVIADCGYKYENCGLMLTWLVMGATSLTVGSIACALGGAKNIWATRNFILAGGLAMTVYISKLAKDERLERHVDLCFYYRYPSNALRIGVLSFFGVLGILLVVLAMVTD
ncbi:hypothetical protein AHAS_Ahas14G0197300 [Arachis hypogaea]